VVFLLFRSGKIVITGAKSMAAINRTYRCVYKHIIKPFLDINSSMTSSATYKTIVKREKVLNKN